MLLKPGLDVVDQKEERGVAVLTIERSLLDPEQCPLKRAIDDLVDRGRLFFLIDLSRAQLLDSSDIGRLIRAHERVRRSGGNIHLCDLQPQVARLLEMTRLNTLFEIHVTREDAIQALQESAAQ